jgi:hypothetical protein
MHKITLVCSIHRENGLCNAEELLKILRTIEPEVVFEEMRPSDFASYLRWEGAEPAEEEKQATYDALADSLGKRLLDLATRRVWRERSSEWERSYFQRGTGSTFVRARIIGSEIYEPAAPVPDVAPSPDRNQFMHEVVAEVEAAAGEVGARLQ